MPGPARGVVWFSVPGDRPGAPVQGAGLELRFTEVGLALESVGMSPGP